MGEYEQDNDTTNGKEPLTWLVIRPENDNDQYLVITEKAIDVLPYNNDFYLGDITWAESTIRSWLNGYDASKNKLKVDYTSDNFINSVFTEEERDKIIVSTLPASDNPNYGTSGGSGTKDKIFFLSFEEASINMREDTLTVDATPYCVKKGATVLGSEAHVATSDGSCEDTHCIPNWWIRTPGMKGHQACTVQNNGSFNIVGSGTNSRFVAIRPAMWLKR